MFRVQLRGWPKIIGHLVLIPSTALLSPAPHTARAPRLMPFPRSGSRGPGGVLCTAPARTQRCASPHQDSLRTPLEPVRPPSQRQARISGPGPTRLTSARIPPASPPQLPWQLSLPVPHFRLGTFRGGSRLLARIGRDLLRLEGVASRQGAGPRVA